MDNVHRHQRHAASTRRAFFGGVGATFLLAGAGLKSSWVYAATESPTVPASDAIGPIPAWFSKDVQRKARWLPAAVKQLGVEGAYRQRWNAFPADVQAILSRMAIPVWLIALVPAAADKQSEILKQFRFMADLAGPPPANKRALRVEQLLIFGGAGQLPTPGDEATGASLGAEGCSAAMSKYVLAQLKLEFPRELAAMSDELACSQSSIEMEGLFKHAKKAGIVEMVSRPFAELEPGDFRPGSLTIAQKPGGTHVFGWTRVPKGWKWEPGDKMAISNTGLAPFGNRMILAQEYVTGSPTASGEGAHNEHGPINGRKIIYVHGEPNLGDPRTNVYAAQGSDFILVNLL